MSMLDRSFELATQISNLKGERDAACKRVNDLMELLADAQKERDSSIARVDELELELEQARRGISIGLESGQRLEKVIAQLRAERDTAIENAHLTHQLLNYCEQQRDEARAQAANLKHDLETALMVQEYLDEQATALRQLVRDYRAWLSDAHTDTRTIESDNWMAIYDDLEATARRLLREETPK